MWQSNQGRGQVVVVGVGASRGLGARTHETEVRPIRERW